LLGSKDFLSKGLNNNIGGTPPPLRAQDMFECIQTSGQRRRPVTFLRYW
jgi:hypothetical protein